ncbi:DoxX family protein [Candidatus Woesearchaeota archaeon]|nr:DoxX family protein [Candidatus Woesearchaeota archaeon]
MQNKKGIALLILRVVVGVIFIAHGYVKLFGGIPGFTGLLTNIGVPFPALAAWALAILEFFGGIAILLGILTKLASTLLAMDMAVALFTVHLKNGFFIQDGGIELVFLLLGATSSLALLGSGRWSLKMVISK